MFPKPFKGVFMANLSPKNPQKRDYRTIKDPEWSARRVLLFIHDSKQSSITSRLIADSLECSLATACMKLSALKKWGCIKMIEKGSGKKPSIYIITEWGIKMTNKWRKEEK